MPLCVAICAPFWVSSPVGLSGPVMIVFFSFFIVIPDITYLKAAKPQPEKNGFHRKKLFSV
jgi:hypothetical protein